MIGVGFHNIGSGVLRASNETMVRMIEHHYGERCGHIPLNAEYIGVLVDFVSEDIVAQMSYLSHLFGREIAPITFHDLKKEYEQAPDDIPLVVPYVNVPEAETYVQEALGAQSWGLPGKMTHVLKNKATFYQLVDALSLDEQFRTPDYTISAIDTLARDAYIFLSDVEEIYRSAGLAHVYPVGVMLRAAESDGNYGCCLVHENNGRIVVVPDGDVTQAHSYTQWHDALAMSQKHLVTTMNLQKETRVVISRSIDFVDSPGMSVVMMEDQVESLCWNGQLQSKGARACIGTSTYIPKNAALQRMQEQYEDATAAFFEQFLRRTAEQCEIDFATIRGVANLDIMLPGPLETRLQQQRKQPPGNYLAECNPRWTNYTDAILTVLGVTRREQTIYNMRAVIQEGICTIDKHSLPEGVEPGIVRERIANRDAFLQQHGTRIICRMAKNPMGLIFAGDVEQAQREVASLLTTEKLSL